MEEMVSLQNDQVLESKVRSLTEQLADSTMEDVTSWQSDQSLEGREHVEQQAASTVREEPYLLNTPIPDTEVDILAEKWPANEPKPVFGEVEDMAFNEFVEQQGGRILRLKNLYFAYDER
jgi:hypothetical protein